MSEHKTHLSHFIETLSVPQRGLIEDLRDFRVRRIVWDLDEVMGDTQEVIKAEFDHLAGTNYKARYLDRFDALSFWAEGDGVMTFQEAHELEGRLWTNKDLLSQVLPFPEIQKYSQEAYDNGVEQFVATSRQGALRGVTFEWSLLNYPWIPSENVRITQEIEVRYDTDFKVSTVFSLTPDVHFDDNLDHIGRILKKGLPKTRYVLLTRGFDPRQVEDFRVLGIPGGPKQFGVLMSHNIDTLPSL